VVKRGVRPFRREQLVVRASFDDVARNSGHYIQNNEPALVIDAIHRVVAKKAARRP
jgi:hypothetical protein